MIIRDATFHDLEVLLPLAHEAHAKSPLADIPMNDAIVQRNLVTAIQFEDGFAKVAEKDGAVLGGLVGIIADSHYGIRCAQDLFNYSNGGTDLLVKAFLQFALSRACRFVQITDLSNNKRYQSLLVDLGLKPGGNNFVGVF